MQDDEADHRDALDRVCVKANSDSRCLYGNMQLQERSGWPGHCPNIIGKSTHASACMSDFKILYSTAS